MHLKQIMELAPPQQPEPAYQQDYIYYAADYVPRPFGLLNTGALCWCNSLLQMMLGISSLNQVLIEHEAEFAYNSFAKTYINIVRSALADTPLPNAGAQLLAEIMRADKGITLGTGQECADEALTLFINKFDSPRIDKLFSNVYELTIDCVGCGRRTSTTRDQAYRIPLFTPVILETEQQFCTYIRAHPSEHDEFKCKCGYKMTHFMRGEKLKMLREVVVIIFNKFQSKHNRWFPERLQFPARDGTTLRYKLTGKIEHAGNQFGGHYWAHSLREADWYALNDTSVGPGTPAPSESTFMICYQMIDPKM